MAEPDFPHEDLPEDFAGLSEAHEGPYVEPRKFHVDGGEVEILLRAREVLEALLEKYAEHGSAQFTLPDILEVPPFNGWGNVRELAARFGGSRQLRAAVNDLQCRLYAA